MEKEPLHPEIKIESFVLNDKCAEVYRNNNLGTYSFLCYACGETLDSTTAVDSIFKHLDSHYYFEAQDEQLEVKQEEIFLEEFTNPMVAPPPPPLQSVFLDASEPIIIKDIITSAIKNDDTFICDICENTFTTKYDLIKHLREHSTRLIGNTTQTNINSANKNEQNTDMYHCDKCNKKYLFISSLRRHYKKKHPEIVRSRKQTKDKVDYNCNQCDRTFRSKGNLNQHYKEIHLELVRSTNHTEEKSYKKEEHPELCPADTTTTGTFTCDLCNKTFTHIKNYTEHLNSHTIMDPFKCNVCEKVFKRHRTLKTHEKVHDPSTIKHACDICDKKFRCLRNLKVHIRTHTGEKPYECTICQKKLITSTELKIHVRRAHTGEKKCQCELCGKHFHTKSNLKAHLRFHNNERPHKCQFCDEKFFTTVTRDNHERKHTGEKPYSCKGCELKFRTSSGLRQHEILHTGAKPYKCKYCDMKFAQNAGRRGHEKSKHGAL